MSRQYRAAPRVWSRIACSMGLVILCAIQPAPRILATATHVGCDVSELVNAINAANASPDADTLELATGCTYTLTQVNNTDPSLGPNGLPVITSDIVINGSGATIAPGSDNGIAEFRIFQIAENGSLDLNTLTLRNGSAVSSEMVAGDGGAIHNSGTLRLRNCTVENNHATPYYSGGGGGVFNTGTAAITDGTFENNSVNGSGYRGVGGGAILNSGNLTIEHAGFRMNLAHVTCAWDVFCGGGAILNSGSMTMTATALSENDTNLNGGAVYGGGTLAFSDNSFVQNRAVRGGALFAIGSRADSTRDAFSKNLAEFGGGIYNWTGTPLNLNASILENNGNASYAAFTIAQDGGAVYNAGTLNVHGGRFDNNHNDENYGIGNGGAVFNSGTLAAEQTSFDGNRAFLTKGGALYNTGDAAIRTSAFVSNLGELGGGLFNEGNLRVSNSTLTRDGTALEQYEGPLIPDGLAIYDRGAAVVTNSTIAGFTGNPMSAVIVCGGGQLTLRNSIVSNKNGNCAGTIVDGGGNIRFPKSDLSCVGAFANPKLGPLQDNGGATQTMALAPDSLAINAANNAYCLATDQRGIARPQGKHCDSGAFELEPPTLPALLTPPNKKQVKSRAKLTWTAAERVANYRVAVRMDNAKGKKVVNEQVTTLAFETPALESGHWYYWRVKACSKVGCTAAAWWKFRVK